MRDNISYSKTLKNLKNINGIAKIELIQGNSYFDKTEAGLERKLDGQKVDMLFIDGDHTKDGVMNDYKRYQKYVREGGFIIFDDYHHRDVKNTVDILLKDKKIVTIFKSDSSCALELLSIK